MPVKGIMRMEWIKYIQCGGEMILLLSDEEKEWLVSENLHTYIKPGCPEKIRKSLERKLERLELQSLDPLERYKRRMENHSPQSND